MTSIFKYFFRDSAVENNGCCGGFCKSETTVEEQIVEEQIDVPFEEVQTEAYFIWEEAGKPEGKSEEFWNMAEAVLQSKSSTRLADL
jgi:hypothetical protein